MVVQSQAAPADRPPRLRVADLDVAHLAKFAGEALLEVTYRQLLDEGYTGLRHAHGYVFQHLVDDQGPTASELAARLGVSQQAACKRVHELVGLGYVTLGVGAGDARRREVRLTPRGRAAVDRAREVRAVLEAEVVGRLGPAVVDTVRAALVEVIEVFGDDEAIAGRRVPEVT